VQDVIGGEHHPDPSRKHISVGGVGELCDPSGEPGCDYVERLTIAVSHEATLAGSQEADTRRDPP
jgi:hypothetical protein